MPVKTLLIVDIDNTLFDWVRFWRASFGALVDSILSDAAGLERDRLLREIRVVHQRIGTSEYAFILQDLRPVLNVYGVGPAEEERAIQAYRDARAVNRELYPGVRDTLLAIQAQGGRIVGFTESTGYHTADRVRKLDLDGILDAVYSPPDYAIPDSVDLALVRMREPSDYGLKTTRHEIVPGGFKKPNPALLESILAREGVLPADAVYVGDSLWRDVGMAQAASVLDVYAEYGRAGIGDAAEFLLAVTHWSDDELAALATATIVPTITLRESLGELMQYVQFRKGGSLTDKDIAELRLKVWEKTVEVQQHFNDLALRIRNLFVTLLAATLAVVGYGIKAGPGQAGTTPLSVLMAPYIPLVTGLGVAICFAFWFLDRLWYHRLLRGAVTMGTALEAELEKTLGNVGLTRTITKESHMQFGPFVLDATLRLDFFYGLFAFVLVLVGESILAVPPSTLYKTYVVAAYLALGAIAFAVMREWESRPRRKTKP